MQSLLGLTGLFVGLLALGACARPTIGNASLEDEGVDPAQEAGGQEEVDGGPSESDAAEPEPGDAGLPNSKPDANTPAMDAGSSCVDRDQDSVCDGEDNCPDNPNSDQADGDDDGTGDACETDAGGPMSACNAASVPASVTSGDAELSNVRVNGVSSPATVRRGQRLSVSISYAFGECALPIPGQPRFMVIGLEGRASGDCQLLVEVPCPTPVSSEVTLMVDAPAVSGPAYVVAMGRQGFACSDALNNAKRVAALCVE